MITQVKQHSGVYSMDNIKMIKRISFESCFFFDNNHEEPRKKEFIKYVKILAGTDDLVKKKMTTSR